MERIYTYKKVNPSDLVYRLISIRLSLVLYLYILLPSQNIKFFQEFCMGIKTTGEIDYGWL